MQKQIFRLVGLAVCSAILGTTMGCMNGGSNQRGTYHSRRTVQVQANVAGDDYDYYPGYEIYYSRNRQEYVYRDGRAWVRRSEPRGVPVAVLFASPSVRVDFHDSPSRHHRRVMRTYPRHWAPPVDQRDDRHDRREDRRKDRDDREDRGDENNARYDHTGGRRSG